MSAWDEKAYEHAEGRSGEHFGALPEQLFEWGARWQREALLADDVIERAARAQWDRDDHDNMWEDEAHNAQCPELREDYRADALAVLTAALGIEGDDNE